MVQILEAKTIRDEAVERLKKEVGGFSLKPTLAIIQIGNNEESLAYIKQKKIFADKIGVAVKHLEFGADISQSKIIDEIKSFNADKAVQGIIVQLPLPKNFDEYEIIETIDPSKDIDGLTSVNWKLLAENSPKAFVPATAQGILNLLNYYQIDVAGKHIVVVGRSMLVGKSTALLLLNQNATVTIAHSQTKNLQEITKQADILIVAIGKPMFIDASYVREGQVIIDVGINVEMNSEKKRVLCGDVNLEEIKDIVSAISPVPGGVGLMTVVALFENLIKAQH